MCVYMYLSVHRERALALNLLLYIRVLQRTGISWFNLLPACPINGLNAKVHIDVHVSVGINSSRSDTATGRYTIAQPAICQSCIYPRLA